MLRRHQSILRNGSLAINGSIANVRGGLDRHITDDFKLAYATMAPVEAAYLAANRRRAAIASDCHATDRNDLPLCDESPRVDPDRSSSG